MSNLPVFSVPIQAPGHAGSKGNPDSERPAASSRPIPMRSQALVQRDLPAKPGGVNPNSGHFGPEKLPYPYHPTDAGRAASRRPRQRDDCTVRALALARGLSYDIAYDMLTEAGRKCARRFDMATWLNSQDWAHKISFPAIKGERRMNPATFCTRFQRGIYICRVAKHVFTIIDGVLHDNFPVRPDRCIYTAWEVC